MKTTKKTITILWKTAVAFFYIVLFGYITLCFLLPAPQEPEPISLCDSIFESVFEPFDEQFVSIYVSKTVSSEESRKYIQELENLNSGFDRSDLTELVGFDKPLRTISRIRCLVMIDCSSSKFLRLKEECFDQDGCLSRYITSDERNNAWVDIPKNSTIDRLDLLPKN